MRKPLLLAASGAVAVTLWIAGGAAAARPASPTHIGQYNPNVPTTARSDVASITTEQPQGVGDATRTGALPTTGSDSVRLAGEGLALVLAGSGAILVRRRYAARS